MSSARAASLPGLAAILLFASAAFAAPPLSPKQQGEDFDLLCKTLDDGYAYFDIERSQWRHGCDKWRPAATRAATRADFVAALEGLVSELHDDNVTLSERSPGMRRLPWETDLYAVWRDDVAYLDSVRIFGDADVAGMRAGVSIVSIDDVPVEQAARNRLGPGPHPRRAWSWALRHALAGAMSGTETITVRDPQNVTTTLRIDRIPPQARAGRPVFGRRMGDDRDIGYMRVRIGADDAKLPGQFDAALEYLMDTRGLIIDVRDHPGPGTPDVTRAILSRFATTETAWQLREIPNGPRVFDSVAPRGRIYKGKVIVLVDRWTAAEGEAVALGLAAVANARIVGTRMTGLRGVLHEVSLPHCRIAVNFPAERTYLVSGERRESYVPEVLVDLAAPGGGPSDPVLSQGLKLLEPCPGSACRSVPGSQLPSHGSLRR